MTGTYRKTTVKLIISLMRTSADIFEAFASNDFRSAKDKLNNLVETALGLIERVENEEHRSRPRGKSKGA